MKLNVTSDFESVKVLSELVGENATSFIRRYEDTDLYFMGYCPPHTDEDIDDSILPETIRIQICALEKGYVFFVIDEGGVLNIYTPNKSIVTFKKYHKHGILPQDKLGLLQNPKLEQDYYDSVNTVLSNVKFVWRYIKGA